MIADKTAKSLRNLGTPVRVYPGPGQNRRRSRGPGVFSLGFNPGFIPPPDEVPFVLTDDEDESDFHSMLDMTSGNPATEGVRASSDVYETYAMDPISAHGGWGSGNGLIFTASGPSTLSPLSSPDEEAPPAPASPRAFSPASLPPSPPAMRRSPPRMFRHPVPAVSLTRQGSLRRRGHSRTSEFDHFSSSRRRATRDRDHEPEAREDGPSQSSGTTRRFFPLHRRWGYNTWSEALDSADSSAGDPTIGPTPSSATWNSATSAYSGTGSGLRFSMPESQPPPVVPRIRRGGIRAPETMFVRHPTPPALPDTRAVPSSEEAITRVVIQNPPTAQGDQAATVFNLDPRLPTPESGASSENS